MIIKPRWNDPDYEISWGFVAVIASAFAFWAIVIGLLLWISFG